MPRPGLRLSLLSPQQQTQEGPATPVLRPAEPDEPVSPLWLGEPALPWGGPADGEGEGEGENAAAAAATPATAAAAVDDDAVIDGEKAALLLLVVVARQEGQA